MKIFSSRTNKQGSLQLSINAIVVLVMAMVVLGLGLGFIRNLINKGQDKFEGAIKMTDIENKASATEPLKVDRDVSMKSGGSTELKVSFYNTDTSAVDVSITPSGGPGTLNCYGASGTAGFSMVSMGQHVDPGSVKGYRVLLSDDGSASTGRYTCSIVAYDGSSDLETTNFYLTITG